MRHLAILGVHGAFGAELLVQCLSRNSADRVFVFDELADPLLESDVRAFLSRRGVAENCNIEWLRLRPTDDSLGLDAVQKEALFAAPLSVFVAPHRPAAGMAAEDIRCLATYVLRQLAVLLQGRDAHLHYASSHLSAGDRMGAFTEYDVDCGQKPRNALEFAAFEGEAAVRALFAKRRLNIYRLPFLAGASADGLLLDADSPFEKIAQALTANSALYADPTAIVPVAAVDHVAGQVLALALAADTSGTYHIAGCGQNVAALRDALGAGTTTYRGMPAYRLRMLFSRSSDTPSTRESATAAFSVAHALYPQTHHDSFRYDTAAERLGLTHASTCPPPRAAVAARDVAVHARYITALRSYTTLCTLGLLHHDPEWSRQAVIDDIVIPYLDVGHGTPIVLLAGALGPEYWLGVLRYLSAGHRCILMGTVGWSAITPNRGDYAGHEEQAALVKGLLAHLDLRDAVHFVCSDVSAPTMQYFASRWPERIATLQWVNPITTPHEMSRLLPVSMRTTVLDTKGRGKLIVQLEKSDATLRSMSGFDTLIRDGARRAPERWRRLQDQIGTDPARLRLFCAALCERLAEHPLPGIDQMKCHVHVLWSCDNPVGDLSLYARSGADRTTPPDVTLIADAGVDVAEAQPIQVGSMLARHISARGKDRAGPAGAIGRNAAGVSPAHKAPAREVAAGSNSRVSEHV